jgi:hypothetical protein
VVFGEAESQFLADAKITFYVNILTCFCIVIVMLRSSTVSCPMSSLCFHVTCAVCSICVVVCECDVSCRLLHDLNTLHLKTCFAATPETLTAIPEVVIQVI